MNRVRFGLQCALIIVVGATATPIPMIKHLATRVAMRADGRGAGRESVSIGLSHDGTSGDHTVPDGVCPFLELRAVLVLSAVGLTPHTDIPDPELWFFNISPHKGHFDRIVPPVTSIQWSTGPDLKKLRVLRL